MLLTVLVVAILVTSYGQIVLNRWNQPFYDAITRRDLNDFLYQLGMYFAIVGALLILDVFQRWLTETVKFRLREGLTRDLLEALDGAASRVLARDGGGPMGVNPDQRMSEDARKLCDMSTDLSIGLFRSTVLFVSFAGVLWMISKDFTFRVGGVDYAVPGLHAVGRDLRTRCVGSLLSYWVGRSLVGRNADRYAREADLRFALVRINEHVDGIALAAGETDERRRVEMHLGNLMIAMRRLVRGLTNLTWVTAGFGWVTDIAPILVAAPLYFTRQDLVRRHDDGGGRVHAGAGLPALVRRQLQRARRLAGSVAARRELPSGAGCDRVAASLRKPDRVRRRPARRHGLRRAASRISGRARGLQRAARPDSRRRAHADLRRAGRRKDAAVQGDIGALAMGKRPHRPAARRSRDVRAARHALHAARNAPRSARLPAHDRPLQGPRLLGRALERTRLGRYASSLDAHQRWDRELREDEQMASRSRASCLQAPPWVVFDDTFSAMEDETLERVVEMFMHELKQTTVIHIGRSTQMHLPLFERVLHLRRFPSERSTEEKWVNERILRKAR